jgi:hypothetical protein
VLPWFTLVASPSVDKNQLDFSKEKNREEHSRNSVDGSDRTRFYRSGEGRELNMLCFRRLLCFLFWMR